MNNNIVFKRKYRYTLEATLPGGNVEPFWVKIGCRPTDPIVTTGGHSEQLHVIVYEMDLNNEFWKVIQPSLHENVPFAPEDKLGTFVLKMYDGCGMLMETHTMSEAYISSLVFGDTYPDEYVCFEFDVRYRKLTSVPNGEYKYIPPTFGGLGLCAIPAPKTKCPNCQHEFFASPIPNPSIIY
jgi:hypothetical protein